MLWQSVFLSLLLPFLHPWSPENLGTNHGLVVGATSLTSTAPPSQGANTTLPPIAIREKITIEVSTGKPFVVPLALDSYLPENLGNFTFVSPVDWIEGLTSTENTTYILGGEASLEEQTQEVGVIGQSGHIPIGFTLQVVVKAFPYESLFCDEECTERYPRYSSKTIAVNATLALATEMFFFFCIACFAFISIPLCFYGCTLV